ncbi:MAG: hypothetical protein GF320_00745 [Armatimonadia bacterium]|nr:hypothetical protein [Armatimonadia bacterium]
MPSMTPDGRRSILVIRLSAIGDCVMTSPAVAALREACPDDFIAWVVEPKSAPVVVGSEYVDEVIVWERRADSYFTPGAMANMQRRLRPYSFDVALDFHGIARSALVSAASKAPDRIAFLDAREGATLAANDLIAMGWAGESVVERNMRMLQALGIESTARRCYVPVSDEGRAEVDELLEAEGHRESGLLGLHLRGSWAHKFWPTDRWAAIAHMARDRWGLVPMILGGPADRPDAEALMARCDRPLIDTVGRISLGGCVAAIERCSAVVGPDTGTIHISGALGVPTVCLFGPTSPELLKPPGEHVRALIHRMHCHPCVRRPTCRNYECMHELRTEWVVEALDELLARGRAY